MWAANDDDTPDSYSRLQQNKNPPLIKLTGESYRALVANALTHKKATKTKQKNTLRDFFKVRNPRILDMALFYETVTLWQIVADVSHSLC